MACELLEDHQFKTRPKNDARRYFSCAQSDTPNLARSIYPSLQGELPLSMRGKPADVDNHTDSFAILRISVSSLTYVHHSELQALTRRQCGIAASNGNQIIGLIRRNITHKGKKLIIPLYKAIVRPHLEYCIQAWRPYRKKDIYTLERIQRKATKIIPELKDLSHEERLKECGLTTLETRRLRGDRIEVFKILNGYENIDRNVFSHSRKIVELEDMR